MEMKSIVAYRSAHQRHHRTQSVLTRRPPHPTDVVWNAFVYHKDGSMQWIPEQIVGIGEDFHNHVDVDKVKATLYKVRWNGSNSQDHVRSHHTEGGLSGMSGLVSNPANREIALSSWGVGAP